MLQLKHHPLARRQLGQRTLDGGVLVLAFQLPCRIRARAITIPYAVRWVWKVTLPAGVGSAMFSISSMSLLVRLVPPDRRGRAVGLWSGGFLLGGISGPAVGGLVAAWSLRAPFFTLFHKAKPAKKTHGSPQGA